MENERTGKRLTSLECTLELKLIQQFFELAVSPTVNCLEEDTLHNINCHCVNMVSTGVLSNEVDLILLLILADENCKCGTCIVFKRWG